MENKLSSPGRARRPGRPRLDGSVRMVLNPDQQRSLDALQEKIAIEQSLVDGMSEGNEGYTNHKRLLQMYIDMRTRARKEWGISDIEEE